MPPVPEQWTGPFAPGKGAKPSGHCTQQQPCTWAKRGSDQSKAQVGCGQSRQAHTNAESSLLSPSLCHIPLVCRTDPLWCLLSSNLEWAPFLFPWPCKAQIILYPPTISLQAPETSSDYPILQPLLPSTAPWLPTGTGMGCPSQRSPPGLGCWPLSVPAELPTGGWIMHGQYFHSGNSPFFFYRFNR